MRAVIVIEREDRHTIELFLTPPGRPEVLAELTVYERTKR